MLSTSLTLPTQFWQEIRESALKIRNNLLFRNLSAGVIFETYARRDDQQPFPQSVHQRHVREVRVLGHPWGIERGVLRASGQQRQSPWPRIVRVLFDRPGLIPQREDLVRTVREVPQVH